jgi:hypothetical protein
MWSPQVFTELVDAIKLRISDTNEIGKDLSWHSVVSKQFKRISTPTYGISILGEWIKMSIYFLYANITICALYVVYCLRRERKNLVEKYIVSAAAILLMSLIVVLRYGIMKNHSDIHVHFVNRYLFVFAGSIYFYTIWLLTNQPFRQNN